MLPKRGFFINIFKNIEMNKKKPLTTARYVKNIAKINERIIIKHIMELRSIKFIT